MSRRRRSWLRSRPARAVRQLASRLRAPLAASLLLVLVACVAEEVETHHREPASLAPELVGEPVIRVLIAENQKQLRVAVAGPCRIVPNVGDPVFPDRLDESAVTPDDRSLGLKLGEHAFLGASELRFAPTGGAPIQLEGKPYEGELVVKLSPRGEGTLQAIDHVRAEQYVAGVIGGEMPLKWPDAALKAQSIAARTYAIWHWKNTPGLDHDVTADTRSQVYTGQATERARELVAATEGRVLTWQSRMFEAYFFAACSGETASAEWVFEGPAIEPLQGAKCGFCIASPHATWERKITQAELAKGLAGFGVKGRIERVETVTWPRGGYVREVRVHVEGGEVVSVPGPKFRFAFAPALKSAAFEVAADATGSVLVVTGHGWGHGVGLCQWGAKGCAETGMDEDQILARYYPGAAITKLY